MAFLCGMVYLPPFVIHGTFTITKEEIDQQGKDMQQLMIAIRDGDVDFDKAQGLSRLNSDINSLLVKAGT